MKLAGATATAGVLGMSAAPRTAARQDVHEIVHWSWLTASDGEIWQQMIDAFNEAHADEGLRIRMEVVPDDQYGTKVLSSAAVGQAPDFGWGTAGLRADWIDKGVVVALDDLVAAAELDLADFTEHALNSSRYPTFDNKLYMVPMDAMSLQVLLNLDHAAEAGLDSASPPTTGEELLEWAKAMTVMEGDSVTRSGWLMTGAGVQPSVTWGIVAEQMGFQRANADLTEAAVKPEAGASAAQWVLDLFDTHKVATRDVTDRYKAFGTGQGAMFLTGPWTLAGYVADGLNFTSFRMPAVGENNNTYYELGGLEMYTQTDPARYEQTAKALKWLSDNSFLWTTEGRGAAVRTSLLDREDYRTSGLPWDIRAAFVEGLETAVIGEIPVKAAPDFTIYTGSGFVAQTMDPVWANERSADEGITMLADQWTADLAAG
jgi:ABC-type glycerol-3-phosphate transport system substrate-binding protein